MKNLRPIVFASVLLLAPAFALAQTAGVSASAQATSSVNTGKPRPLVAPPPIKNVNRDTNAFLSGIRDERRAAVASSTAELRARIEAKQVEVRLRVEAAKARALERFGEAVQRSVNNIVERLSGNAENLSTIADRIGARIEELESSGADASASAELLIKARADITAAQDSIAAAGTVLAAALASSDPKAQMPKVRAAVAAAETAIRQAKLSLQMTLDSLKTLNQ